MKKNIAVVSGGDSGEYGISVQSGKVVEKYLDPEKYNIYPITIKGTEWLYECPAHNVYDIDKNDFSIAMIGEKIEFDCVFIAIHGTPGEDGKLQGYFDMMGIPYTTCDHVTSALTFNKHFCKSTVRDFGVLTAKSMFLTETLKNEAEIKSNLSLPLFVKPNNGGSSVGMSKINTWEELNPAIEKAFAEDDEILVEEFIKGREITCGVFKYKNKITPLPVTEIISKKEWFDFEAKYDPSLADEIVPAQIPEDVFKNCQSTSLKLYQQLNCKGVVRFDYIYNNSGMYFLEVNTVPGLTEASIVPKMVKAEGILLGNFFNTLVEEALQ
jgi:D-alanine-D-alanine ligase